MVEAPDIHQDMHSRNVFGFWTYLMTDCILFATLFATYAVLHTSTFGGPSGKELFDLPSVLAETMFLLISSFTCGLATLAAYNNQRNRAIGWFLITFMFGVAFLTVELTEFTHLVQTGNSWQRSAFLSSFFTLVGTHGMHITVGLIWMAVMIGHLIFRGLTSSTIRRVTCLGMFWHFLDVVWIFIFTIVYLLGVLE